jgi:hypothetical protein
MKLTHDAPETKSAPGVYIVHLERPGVSRIRFFRAGETLAEQAHRSRLSRYQQPIILEEVTG